jgi:hypothetical protein
VYSNCVEFISLCVVLRISNTSRLFNSSTHAALLTDYHGTSPRAILACPHTCSLIRFTPLAPLHPHSPPQNTSYAFSMFGESPQYVDEHLYNIQCSEIFTLRNEKLHTEA